MAERDLTGVSIEEERGREDGSTRISIARKSTGRKGSSTFTATCNGRALAATKVAACCSTSSDGKVDHIEGDPNDEFSRGRLCMRCLNMVDEAINNPTRLGHPLKRVGKRGENKWEQISWDEAYDMIEEHVRAAWDEIGPEAIVALEGTGRNVVWQIPLLEYSAFKSPNFGCGFLSGDFKVPAALLGFRGRYGRPCRRRLRPVRLSVVAIIPSTSSPRSSSSGAATPSRPTLMASSVTGLSTA